MNPRERRFRQQRREFDARAVERAHQQLRDAAAQISAALANEETSSKVIKKTQTTQGGAVNAAKAIRRFHGR